MTLRDDAPVVALTDDFQPVYALPGGVETTDRCWHCGCPFFARSSNAARQKTCGKETCRRAYANRNRPNFRAKTGRIPCAVCGEAFAPKSPTEYTCAAEACDALARKVRWHRWALGEGVAEKKGMRRETVAENLRALLAQCVRPEAFRVSLPPTVDASPPLTPGLCPGLSPPPSPQQSPAPCPFSVPLHLPATALPLALAPARTLTLDHANAVHAAVSKALDRPHDPNLPAWSLTLVDQTVSPSGVVVCVRLPEDAARLRAAPWPIRVGDRTHQVTAGRPWTATLKAPPLPAPGMHRVRLDTVTPVVVKRSVRVDGKGPGGRTTQHHGKPTAAALASTLKTTLAPRIGVAVRTEDLAVEVVRADTESTRDVLRGTGGKVRMHAAGWEGRLELRVNALALWLLRCAERGMGLGGRVAFGFGQVRLTEASDDPAPPAPTPLKPTPRRRVVVVREDVVEQFREAAPPARRVKAVGASPPQGDPVAPPPAPVQAETPTVGAHAVRRYAERVLGLAKLPTSSATHRNLHRELAALVALSRPHRRIPPRPREYHLDDPWEWRGPRLAQHDGARLRLVVGRSTEPVTSGRLVVATVLAPLTEK